MANTVVPLPSGATPLPFRTCLLVGNGVTAAIGRDVFSVPTRAGQLAGLTSVGQFATLNLVDVRKARKAWLAHGFPRTFPAVVLIDEKVAQLGRLSTVAKDGDLDAVPDLYSSMQLTDLKYIRITGDNPRLCST